MPINSQDGGAAMIFRKKSPPRYTIVSNTILEDITLSWAARGMAVYLLSRPDDWQINVSHLVKQGPSGKDALYRVMQELVDHGYLERVQGRNEGKFDVGDWNLYEEPICVTNLPQREKPDTVKPDTVKPDTGNPTLLITESIPSTDITNSLCTTYKEVADSAAGLPFDHVPAKAASSSPVKPRKTHSKIPPLTDAIVIQIINAWKTHFPDRPKPTVCRGDRRKNLNTCWRLGFLPNLNGKTRYFTSDEAVEWWEGFIETNRESKFLREGSWFTFDWMIHPDHFQKILEGHYDNKVN
jgi:hypothetical protein